MENEGVLFRVTPNFKSVADAHLKNEGIHFRIQFKLEVEEARGKNASHLSEMTNRSSLNLYEHCMYSLDPKKLWKNESTPAASKHQGSN